MDFTLLIDDDAVLWRRTTPEAPLLVLLHGIGSHEGDLFGLIPQLPDHLNVAALRAPLPWPHGGRAWFELTLTPDGQISYDQARVDAVGQVLADWLVGLDEQFAGVGLLGFSQGAAMALRAATLAPEVVDCVVMLSGLLPFAPETGAPRTPWELPVFAAIGDHDDVIGGRARALVDWLSTNTRATVHHYPIGHWVSQDEMRDVHAFLSEHLV